jgi:hypothetical protein
MTAPDVTVSDITPGDGTEWVSLAPYGYSKYEFDRRGGYGRDQQPVRNKATGNLMSVGEGTQKRNTHRRGYLQVKLYPDEGVRKTIAVHILVLLVNVGPPPEGMQTRHLDNDPWNNLRDNLVWGSGPEQHKDQVEAGTASPLPEVECVNHAKCGGMAATGGRRCVACMTVVGEKAARLLRQGMHRADVAVELGYAATSGPYVEGLAISFGGYVKPTAQVRPKRRAPKRTLRQRVAGWFRRGGGR